MKLNVVRFYNPILKVESPLIHSDTVFGAICHAIAELEGDKFLVDMLKEMENNPINGFCVSGMFPFIETGESLKHLIPLEILSLSKKKETKKKFVDIEFFNEKNKDLSEYLHKPPEVKYRARNRVGRPSEGEMEETTLFSVPFLGEDDKTVGLWCAYYGDKKVCEEAFRFLEDEGIGGDRNVSWRCEKIEFTTVDVLEAGNYFVNLSLYVPTEEELEKITKKCWYKLVQRQGWREQEGVGRGVKPTKYFFTEGSIFSAIQGKKVYGRCAQFRKVEGIWWSGITIPLFFPNAEEVITFLQSEEH